MAARLKSKVPRMKTLARADAAQLLNQAANAHVVFSQLVVPRKTGALMNSIKQGDEATAENLRTKVTAGGDDVDYAVLVNNGHATSNGGYVPGTFYFDQGLELGQQRVANHRVKLDG